MAYFIQSKNFTPEWLSTFLAAFAKHVECMRINYYPVSYTHLDVYKRQLKNDAAKVRKLRLTPIPYLFRKTLYLCKYSTRYRNSGIRFICTC